MCYSKSKNVELTTLETRKVGADVYYILKILNVF